ncbi:MAG: YfiR family protein [Candidatus Omnitrophota bacterium]|jgi:hypothetical protein|nr:MAG: YfiR family protein [Candidatus Omnitrophota bacterium]
MEFLALRYIDLNLEVKKPGRRALSGLFHPANLLNSMFARILFCFWLITVNQSIAVAAPLSYEEYDIKAAQIFALAKSYVTWPTPSFQSNTSPLILCILGNDPFGDKLDHLLRGEKINYGNNQVRGIEVKRVNRIEDLEYCHILFIDASEKTRLPKIFEKIRSWHVLTISEFEGFAQQGGIINFFFYGKTIRFEINLDALSRVGLKISSLVLELEGIKRIREEKD